MASMSPEIIAQPPWGLRGVKGEVHQYPIRRFCSLTPHQFNISPLHGPQPSDCSLLPYACTEACFCPHHAMMVPLQSAASVRHSFCAACISNLCMGVKDSHVPMLCPYRTHCQTPTCLMPCSCETQPLTQVPTALTLMRSLHKSITKPPYAC